MQHPLLLPYCRGVAGEGGAAGRAGAEQELIEVKKMMVVLKEQLAAANGQLLAGAGGESSKLGPQRGQGTAR